MLSIVTVVLVVLRYFEVIPLTYTQCLIPAAISGAIWLFVKFGDMLRGK